MIETRHNTPYGQGRVLIYNDHSARFWANKGDNCTLVINGVEHTVDFQINRKDDGSWDLGSYEEPHYTNGQRRNWRRNFVDIKRADWIQTDKYASDSARKKAQELVEPFIEFIKTQGDSLAKAQIQERTEKAQRLESTITVKRQEIEKLMLELEEINQELGRKPLIEA